MLIFVMHIDKVVHPETIMGMKFQKQLIYVILVKAGVTNKSSFLSFLV